MLIVPTLLVPTYNELAKQLKKVKPFFDYAQLDIMDGQLVENKSFNYNEDRNFSKFFNDEIKIKLKYELHLIVKNPLNEIAKWKKVKNVFRVIFHIEADDDPAKIIAKICANGWQAGIALNPETPLRKITPYLNLIDVVLFMTVHPGQQGASFLPEVGEKIKIFNTGGGTTKPIIAVDGGINANNIAMVKSWGVEVFNIGSVLMNAKDIKKAYKELAIKTKLT